MGKKENKQKGSPPPGKEGKKWCSHGQWFEPPSHLNFRRGSDPIIILDLGKV